MRTDDTIHDPVYAGQDQSPVHVLSDCGWPLSGGLDHGVGATGASALLAERPPGGERKLGPGHGPGQLRSPRFPTLDAVNAGGDLERAGGEATGLLARLRSATDGVLGTEPAEHAYDLHRKKEPMYEPVLGNPRSAHAGDHDTSYASTLRLFLLLLLWVASVGSWITGAFVLSTLEIVIAPDTPYTSRYKRSLVMTLVDLYHSHSYFAVSVLGFFSVCVPTVKLASTFWLITKLCCEPVEVVYRNHRRLIWALYYVASYQLTDLYVGVLFVTFFNSDSANAKFLDGFYWFFRYCMISMVMSLVLDKAFPREEDNTFFSRETSRPGGTVTTALEHRITAINSSHRSWDSGQGAYTRTRPEGSPVTLMFFVVTFFVFFCTCYWRAGVEVRTVYDGVAIDRSAHSLADIFGSPVDGISFLAAHADGIYAAILVCLNVVFPVLFVLATAALALCSAPADVEERGWSYSLLPSLAELLRTWSTLDVFCWATLVFLFTVQDPHTLTAPSEGSVGLYLLFGAGFSLFFLRWFSDAYDENFRKLGMCAPHLWLVIFAWLAACYFVGGASLFYHDASRGGAVGTSQARRDVFEGLDSVCANVMPVLSSTLRKVIPPSLGDCNGSGSGLEYTPDMMPPNREHCSGNKPLYSSVDNSGYIQALWLAGLNTIHLHTCYLWKEKRTDHISNDVAYKDPTVTTRYHLSLGGSFDFVKLFLHLKKCSAPFGCTLLNSADHCCGENIKFNITFGLECRPSVDGQSFKRVVVEGASIDSMMPNLDFFGGTVQVKVVDIAPTIERLVKDHFSDTLNSAKFRWAGEERKLPDLLNRLIKYNSPASAGTC